MAEETTSSATSGLEPNIAGLLSYLFGWISGLIFLLIDKRSFVRFHAAQAIGLTLGAVVVFIVFGVIAFVLTIVTTMLGFPIGILTFFLYPLIMFGIFGIHIFCMYKAFKNEKFKVPVIGNIVEKMVGA